MTTVLVVVADQASKAWAESSLEHNVSVPLFGELLQWRLIYNSGAAFGMGSQITPILTCVQIAIAVGIVVGLVRVVRNRWWALALGLLLGGALGNIHDRLLRPPGPFHGFVVDFLQLPRWPIFNIADIAVTSGAILLILLTFRGVPAGRAPAASAEEPDASARREP